MKYLITGTPRSRTAWLAAVMTAHGSHCHHDALVYGANPEADVGFSDAGIGCMQPALARHCTGPIIVVRREDWVRSFERTFDLRLTPKFIDQCEGNIAEVEKLARLVLPWQALQHSHVVAELVEICTGTKPNRQTIDLFQQFNIQQDVPRARAYASKISA